MKIKITEDILIKGKVRSIGEILPVGEKVTIEDARYIVSMGRAFYVSDDSTEQTGTGNDSPTIESLIDQANELGIKKAEKKSREELIALIEEKQIAKLGDDIPTDPDDDIENLDEAELVVLAESLDIMDSHVKSREELITEIKEVMGKDDNESK